MCISFPVATLLTAAIVDPGVGSYDLLLKEIKDVHEA